jgi:ACS family tartrate transporter-like MFS transporter
MQVTATPDSYERVLRKISLRLLPFMFLLYIISYLDRINVSFAGIPMCADLHFGEDIFGFGAGVFFLGYCLFGVPSNLALQKVGARKWIACIMVVWGMVSVSMAFVPNSSSFFCMRFLLGVAESGFFPGMIFYLTRWYPKREHGLAVARFMTAVPAAGLLGSFISSKILAMQPLISLAPWKWLFIITGSPSVLLGFVVLLYLPDGPADAKWLSADEKELVVSRLQEQQRPQAEKVSVFQAVLQSVLDLRVWLLALLYFSLTLGMYGFQLWLPQIIDATSHGGAANTALLTALPAVFQAVGMIGIATHSDKTGERKWHLAGAAFVAAAGLIMAALLRTPEAMMASLCITAFGIWGTVGPFWAIPTSFLGGTSAASAIALINSMGNLGGFAGPYFVGKIKSLSPDFSTSLLFMAVSLTLGGLIAISLKLKEPTGEEGPAAH